MLIRPVIRTIRGVLIWAVLLSPANAQSPTARVTGDSLRPISLEEALLLADGSAPALVQARGQVRVARSTVRSALGAFLPSVDISAGQTRQGGSRFDSQGLLVPYAAQPWSYSTGFGASINLFDGGKRFWDLSARRADVAAQDANEVAQRFAVALQVKTAYAAVLAAREGLLAARAQEDQASQQWRVAIARVVAGAAPGSDSLRAAIQAGNGGLAVRVAEASIRASNAALTRLVATPYGVTAGPDDSILQKQPLPDSLLLLNLAAHGPAVKQAEWALASGRATRKAAWTAYVPSLTLRVSRDGSGFDPRFGVGAGALAYSNRWSLGLNMPGLNGFAREEQVTRASAAEQILESQRRDALLSAQQDVMAQRDAMGTALERIAVHERAIALAEEDLRAQQQRYRLGAVSIIDLQASESTLNVARAALIRARQDYRLARAQIEAVIGQILP